MDETLTEVPHRFLSSLQIRLKEKDVAWGSRGSIRWRPQSLGIENWAFDVGIQHRSALWDDPW